MAFPPSPQRPGQSPTGGPPFRVGQGLFYLFLILMLQVGLIVSVIALVLLVGSVAAMPVWVFLSVGLVVLGGGVWGYRKIRARLRAVRNVMESSGGLAGRNYEISIMGGMVTMRVEQPVDKLLAGDTAADGKPSGSTPSLELVKKYRLSEKDFGKAAGSEAWRRTPVRRTRPSD